MKKSYLVCLAVTCMMACLTGCTIGMESGNGHVEFENPYRTDSACEYHLPENGVCTQCGSQIEDSAGLEFVLSEDATYYICAGIGSCTDTQIIVPATYSGKPVREIGDSAFADCEKVKSVVLPEGITHIGEGAFASCRKIEHFVLPDTVLSIGAGAFRYCAQVRELALPSALTEIADELFEGCVRLKAVTVPEGVTEIGYRSFYNCQSLESICFPEGLTGIGKQAFYRCSLITEIVLPASLQSIGQNAFEQCTKLFSVTYTGTLADWLTIDFEYGANPMNVCEQVYIEGALLPEAVVIPDQITELKEYCFQGCNTVQSITIHRGLLGQEIASRALAGCSSLTDLYIDATEEEAKKLVKKISFSGTIHYLRTEEQGDGD